MMKIQLSKKKIIRLLAASLVLASCQSTRVEQSKPVVVQPAVKKDEPKHIEEEKKPEAAKELKFALLMPFNFNENFKETDSTEKVEEPSIDPGSLASLQFYEGAKIAIDSLLKQNIKVSLINYDAPSDSIGLINLMYKQPVMSSDLVFSGVSAQGNSVLAATVKKHQRYLVALQSTSSNIVRSNPFAILANPSSGVQCEMMVKKLLSKYSDASFFIIHRDIKKENDLYSLFESLLDSAKKTMGVMADVQNTVYDPKSFENFQSSLSKTKRNIILIPSSDEAFISPVLTKINSYNYANIVIAGLPTWENFESIDFAELQNLQVMIFSGTFLDPDNSADHLFRKRFIELYKTDPLINAYQGFDLVYYFAKQINTLGDKWIENISNERNPGALTGFKLRHNSSNDGYENTNVPVLLFKEYSLVRVD